ncbi:MAG: hypothetical protein E5Y16_07560 [Mesorhizobium sp.]|nr:MAG: hypothetical protein EOS08_16140 [Mesorhizobium sp.]TJV43705.1 MAG: hypothetical protein E5Y16_07560 [Mesorhizobium sp.]
MAVNHMHLAIRCSAKSKRSGVGCRAPAVRGKNVCRMHGARGGAPSGSAHGLYKHGRYTCEALADRRVLSALISDARRSASAV